MAVGPQGVSLFSPDTEEWKGETAAYAVLSMAMLIQVRDCDLNRTMTESIVQASIEMGIGQDMGAQLANAFMRKEFSSNMAEAA